MQQEKTADLIATKRKALLERLIVEIGRSGFDLYYAPTSQVADHLLTYAKSEGAGLNADELALFDGLSRRDIEIILSIKD
ncbi:MAG: hypothetical protein HRU32_16515 [Rhodobacteraceae bacterium]|nr:hypothetical protein [Paracoccaceae bacterium]